MGYGKNKEQAMGDEESMGVKCRFLIIQAIGGRALGGRP
jgi:hypothetical protein